MSLGNERLIPKFISAPNAKMLRRAMLKNNIKNGKHYRYFNIMKDGSKFIAWFYEEELDPQEIQSVNQEVLKEIVDE